MSAHDADYFKRQSCECPNYGTDELRKYETKLKLRGDGNVGKKVTQLIND